MTVRQRLYLTSALVAVLSLPLDPGPVIAQQAPGGTLGIECDRPRRAPDGKLMLGDHSGWRAMCEADRATALNYALVLRETRARLRAALANLPSPVRENLADHLRTADAIDTWSYTDADILARLRSMQGQPGADQAARSAGGIADFWAGGLLANSLVPADWRGVVRARACGAAGRETVVIWLDPANIRDRWTPQMVQRTVRYWLEDAGGQFIESEDIPDVVVNTGTALQRPDGSPRQMRCLPTVPDGALAMSMGLGRATERGRLTEVCLDPTEVGRRRLMWERRNGVYIVPDTAILEDGTAHPERGAPLLGQANGLPLVTDEATAAFLTRSTCRLPRTFDAVRAEDCPATINGQPVEGTHVRRFRFREIQNDPGDPFRIDMVPVMRDPANPRNPLGIIAPAGAQHPVWETTTLFCEGEVPPSDAPPIPPPQENDPDVTNWDVPDCQAAHGGQFDHGYRTGFIQTITYPDGWPVEDVEVRTIDDHCVRLDPQSGQEFRARNTCPEGHIGSVREAREFSWYNLEWAVPRRAAGTRTLAQATASYSADPAQAGLEWFDVVTLEQDWHTVSNTCRLPSNGGGGGGGDGDDHTSFDVDGDGWGDYRNEQHARQEMGDEAFDEIRTDGNSRTGREVNNGCGSCDGPDDDGGPSDSGASDRRGGGGFWGGLRDTWDRITGRSDDSGGGGGGGGDGCFLTTAIVERRGEADDGPTLTALRAFRDGWMAHHPDGPALVAEYYDIAPRIVAAIPDDHTDWTWIGERVDAAVRCLERSDPEGAFEVYTDMVRHLKAKWLEGSGHPVHWKKELAI